MTYPYERHLRYSLLYGSEIPKLKNVDENTDSKKVRNMQTHFNFDILRRIDLQRSIS